MKIFKKHDSKLNNSDKITAAGIHKSMVKLNDKQLKIVKYVVDDLCRLRGIK